jgi:hypothetical protein
MSLLEILIATSMLAMVLTTVSVVIRSGRAAWEAHEADYTRIESAHATLRHIVREVRHADAVTELTPAIDNAQRLGLLLPSGDIRIWEYDADTDMVNCGIGAPDSPLAPDITGLRIIGLKADATTVAASADEVQCMRIEVTVQLPHEVGGTRTVSSWAWIRSW